MYKRHMSKLQRFQNYYYYSHHNPTSIPHFALGSLEIRISRCNPVVASRNIYDGGGLSQCTIFVR
jgi:hypothetical protein